MNRERIYAVTFNSYTNALRNTVSDGNKDIAKTKYLHISQDLPFLIRESELLYYSKFGEGYSIVKCVGELSEKINKIETNPDTSISSKLKLRKCGSCSCTDGNCYTSNPPKVKCTITGKFHFYDDICDCTDTITATN